MTGSTVAAIILAAGASTRLGEPKQLVRLGGETLLDRAIRMASAAGCFPVSVVLGAHAEMVLAQISKRAAPQIHMLQNWQWREGMAASIRVGIQALLNLDVQGAVVMTCDQPFATAAHLKALATRAPVQITASAYAQRKGVPAYFPAYTFAALLALQGDEGARNLLKQAAALDLKDGDLDVDTPEALVRVRQRFENWDQNNETLAAEPS